MNTRRRIAYDCEFIENGRTIDLVSIGLINIDDPAERYYAVSSIIDLPRLLRRDFLRDHVAPHLPIATITTTRGAVVQVLANHDHVKPPWTIADDVRSFIVDTAYAGVELWADFGAYDHVTLCQLWGGMQGHPAGIPMFSHDLQQYRDSLGFPEDNLPLQDSHPHHALYDALHLADCVRVLDKAAATKRRTLAGAAMGHEPGA